MLFTVPTRFIYVIEHLKVKALKYNLHLIDHSNLQAKSSFFWEDKKHFNRSTGVHLLARNIKAKALRQLPLITGEGYLKIWTVIAKVLNYQTV